MASKTTTAIVAVLLVGVAAVGLTAGVSAQDDPDTPDTDESTGIYKWLGKRHAGHLARAFAHCDDNITVGECKTDARQAHREAHAARCAERFDEDFCADLVDLKKEHKNETTAYFADAGYEPQRPPRGGDKDAWCGETYDEAFCDGLAALKAEHKDAVAALFDEAGYEQPDGKPGHGPRGHGRGRAPGGDGQARGPPTE